MHRSDQVSVLKVTTDDDFQRALKVRYEVYVIGQMVPLNEEVDEFEDESHHYLAVADDKAVGAARWRVTNEGHKLERFAVLDNYRGRGIGTELVKKVMEDVMNDSPKHIYMHAQIDAVPIYEKFGFIKKGDMFIESEIEHYLMTMPNI